MSTFKDYSDYYDLLYKDKDYSKEADRIHYVIQQYAPGAKKLLNLGCGTGNHDFFLNDLGYEIAGVDLSPEMVDRANSKLKGQNRNLSFVTGDVRHVRLNKKFDVVISLFHVLSYQASNEDLINTFRTAADHLSDGGVFIFDCWYGPGVLADLPAIRYKVLENERVKIHRVAEPEMNFNKNLTNVKYTILVENKLDKSFYSIQEVHCMRYLFQPEIELFAQMNKLELAYSGDWHDGSVDLSGSHWQAMFIAKKLPG